MEKLEYIPKQEMTPVAAEIIDFLRSKALPVWQVKEVLREAIKLVEWQAMK